jgi:hypothetical protein
LTHPVKFKSNWFRIKDGTDEFSLGGAEAGANDDCQDRSFAFNKNNNFVEILSIRGKDQRSNGRI